MILTYIIIALIHHKTRQHQPTAETRATAEEHVNCYFTTNTQNEAKYSENNVSRVKSALYRAVYNSYRTATSVQCAD